jgi:hypothetical protein
MKHPSKKDFRRLPRRQQRLSLLRRLDFQRRQIEDYLVDLRIAQYYHGRKRFPDEPDMVALLARIDREICEIRDSR